MRMPTTALPPLRTRAGQPTACIPSYPLPHSLHPLLPLPPPLPPAPVLEVLYKHLR